jgi:L-fucose mutarotase
MLKNVNPLLSPELLYVLRAMGHGDQLVIVDSNFPAHSVAEETVFGKSIRLDSADTKAAAEAILSVFPLDSFVDAPVSYMEVVGNPTVLLDVHADFKRVVDQTSDRAWKMTSIERHAFYAQAKKAFAVVSTQERRPYGCFILTKGIIGQEGNVV